MAHADLLFSSFLRDEGSPPDTAPYNAIICGFAPRSFERAWAVRRNAAPSFAPECFMYPYVLDACARLQTRRKCGQGIHCRVLKEGPDHRRAFGNSPTSPAARCWTLEGCSTTDYTSGPWAWRPGEADDVGVRQGREHGCCTGDLRQDDGQGRRVVWNSMLATHVRSGDIVATNAGEERGVVDYDA
jgi:hypothetical protein